jgi:DNA repair exonuclease SbcCD nuclease subunit
VKIAITADHHLTSKITHPERFTAMENILHRCADEGVDLLIIAGDLFDRINPNFADFEDHFNKHRPKNLLTYIIPGNHDLGLTGSALALDHVHFYTKTTLTSPAEEAPPILLLPYREGATMGEEIAPFAADLPAHQWLLISHGDWTGGDKYPDPYEPGIYMPLTHIDLATYKPREVFLGHIHRPSDRDHVHYPGSPCPINITETGLRRFLIYDTESGEVTSHLVNSPVIYFQEMFLVLPFEGEEEYLSHQISKQIRSWGLPESWEEKVQVRVKVTGYARNRAAIKEIVLTAFDPFSFYEDQGPDLSQLNHSFDPDRSHIAQQFKTWLDDLAWGEDPRQPDKDQILAEALKAIYGN